MNDQLLLTEILRGAKLIFENAEHLYEEAQALGTKGAFCRAVCLHQISIEECSKIDILGAAATSLLMGHALDLSKLAQAMRSHKVKNFNLAYTSECTAAERDAQNKGEREKALEVFRKQQKEIHDHLNTNKNASLYVDFVDGKFVAPAERISEGLAVGMQRLNGEQLAVSESFLRLLGRMAKEPDKLAAIAQDALRHLKDVPASQLRQALEKWLDPAKARFGE